MYTFRKNFTLKIFSFLYYLLFAFSMIAVHAETPSQENNTIITIIGTAEKTIAPDYAALQLGITTYGETVQEAKLKNDKIMSDLFHRLAKHNIPKHHIRTSTLAINPNYDYSQKNKTEALIGYEMSNTITVKIEDFNQIATIVDEASQAGISQINHLHFDFTPNQMIDDQLLSDAINNAKHKASIIAKTLGLQIASIKSVDIQENNDTYAKDSIQLFKSALPSNTPIAKGSLVVTKKVIITYVLH